MARKSFAELAADLLTSFPNNSSGAITPQILRDYFTSFLNAIIPAYAILDRIPPVVQLIAVTDAPLVFTNADTLKANGELTANAAGGEIGRVDKGTTRFDFTADVLSASNSPRTITFTLYRAGVPTVWAQSIVLTSNAQIESLSFTAIVTDPTAENYSMQVKSSVAETIIFSNMVLVGEIVPVQSY